MLLDGWKLKHNELFGDDNNNNIPKSKNLNLSKLGDGDAIMTDNCNAANSINRMLAKEVEAAVEKLPEEE